MSGDTEPSITRTEPDLAAAVFTVLLPREHRDRARVPQEPRESVILRSQGDGTLELRGTGSGWRFRDRDSNAVIERLADAASIRVTWRAAEADRHAPQRAELIGAFVTQHDARPVGSRQAPRCSAHVSGERR